VEGAPRRGDLRKPRGRAVLCVAGHTYQKSPHKLNDPSRGGEKKKKKNPLYSPQGKRKGFVRQGKESLNPSEGCCGPLTKYLGKKRYPGKGGGEPGTTPRQGRARGEKCGGKFPRRKGKIVGGRLLALGEKVTTKGSKDLTAVGVCYYRL